MDKEWFGLVGVLVGAFIGIAGQMLVEWRQHSHNVDSIRRQRGEEILALVAESPWWNVPAKKAALQDPANFPFPPPGPHRVMALVAAYFPNHLETAKRFEQACVEEFEADQEIGKAVKKGQGPSEDLFEAQNKAFSAQVEARNELLRVIATTLHE